MEKIKKYKGKFITFEGSEGSGKSTQINLLHAYLKKKKKPVLFVREPGGVVISEKIRGILLDVKNTGICDECETLLYMAARAQLTTEVIVPALKKGKIVLCDRFLDSTIVYQGYGNGVDIKIIKIVGNFATLGIKPDLTLIFDINTATGLSRISGEKDRIECRPIVYHNRVRHGYLELAKKEPGRVKVIKVDKNKEEIQEVIRGYLNRVLGIN